MPKGAAEVYTTFPGAHHEHSDASEPRSVSDGEPATRIPANAVTAEFVQKSLPLLSIRHHC